MPDAQRDVKSELKQEVKHEVKHEAADQQTAAATPTATATASEVSVDSSTADSLPTGFNLGPTSLLPVWRVQSVEEQAELLGLEAGVKDPAVKREVDMLAADALQAQEKHQQLKPVQVLHYMTVSEKAADSLACGQKGWQTGIRYGC